MSLFENFPYTNLHELNLDWLVDQLNKISESSVLSVNGQTGVVVLYQDAQVVLPNVPEDNWSIVRMADGTHRGILFGNDNKAYIVHGNLMAELYANNNPPPYPVTRVNGLTGDVELYTDQYVRLPDLTDAQMTNWTFFRMLNNTSHGIQFEDDGTAYIINGTSRYVLYTAHDAPPYPVDSVNGQTGTVVLFTDTNGNMAMPAVTDPLYEGWSINRSVNGTNLGLEFKDDGSLILKVGASEYAVYTANEPQANYVSNAADEVQEITVDSDDNFWGLLRTTTEGKVGIMFNNADPDAPEAYIAYTDSNDQDQTVKLVTVDDLPSTGVVSVNAKAGIVTLYASDIEMNLSDSRTIDDAIDDVKKLIAIVENTNTATQNIAVGDYVIWNNSLYVCSNAITIGDTLSLSNLTAVSENIYDHFNKIDNAITTKQLGTTYTTLSALENDLVALNATLQDNEWCFIRFRTSTDTALYPLSANISYLGIFTRISGNYFSGSMSNASAQDVTFGYANGTFNVKSNSANTSGFMANETPCDSLADLNVFLNRMSTNNIGIFNIYPPPANTLLNTTTTHACIALFIKSSGSNAYYCIFNNAHMTIGSYAINTSTASGFTTIA